MKDSFTKCCVERIIGDPITFENFSNVFGALAHLSVEKNFGNVFPLQVVDESFQMIESNGSVPDLRAHNPHVILLQLSLFSF